MTVQVLKVVIVIKMLNENENFIYIIGEEIDELPKYEIPTVRQLLSLYHHNQRSTPKVSVREIIRRIVDELYVIWSQFEGPLREKKHVIMKLERLHQEWRSIQKNNSRRNTCQERKEANFTEKLGVVFDLRQHNSVISLKMLEESLKTKKEKGTNSLPFIILYLHNEVFFSKRILSIS